MLSWVRWSFGFILIHVCGLQIGTAWADPAQKTEERRIVTLAPVVTAGLENPLFLTQARDGSDRLFIVEQPGRIRVLQGHSLHPFPFLDITPKVLFGGERGLLGLAFHPAYAHNGRFFINYTRKPDGATVVAEYRRGETATSAAHHEERILLVVPQPYPNHNGGMVAFGPDGNLYIGLGDGGSKGDPDNRAQNPEDLLGKILRIDVDRGDPYGIPLDNPFAEKDGRPEIYALGLRNPWRFSFDIKTGDLWVADVGQYKWEEINVVVRAGNYGWRVMEGTHCFHPATECRTTAFKLPVVEYFHDQGRCSITGGYVYRGRLIERLAGAYVYGDFCSGEIFALQNPSRGQTLNEARTILKTSLQISSFGEDAAGELYVLDHKGAIYRLTPL
jgi:glucose/arabinose dehydrogenase